jgi:predicted site-specific integrase-resolvase
MTQFPKILSIGDVQRVLGVSRSRVEEFVRQGKLLYQDTLAGKMFLESDVLAFKRDRQRRAKKDPRIKGGR